MHQLLCPNGRAIAFSNSCFSHWFYRHFRSLRSLASATSIIKLGVDMGKMGVCGGAFSRWLHTSSKMSFYHPVVSYFAPGCRKTIHYVHFNTEFWVAQKLAKTQTQMRCVSGRRNTHFFKMIMWLRRLRNNMAYSCSQSHYCLINQGSVLIILGGVRSNTVQGLVQSVKEDRHFGQG